MLKIKFQNKKSWRIDEDTGFLRITSNLAKAGIMEYSRQELESQGIKIPENIKKDTIKVLLPLDELQKESLLKSIEGSDLTEFHAWQDVDSKKNVIGTFAGSAFIAENKFLRGDFIVKDKNAIKNIIDLDFIEHSSAYLVNNFVFESGIFDEIQYDAIQKDLVYNHTALLPKKMGRAGEEVRILNDKGNKMTTQKIRLANSEITVEVAESSVEDVEKLDKKIGEMVDKSKVEELEEQIKTLQTDLDAKEKELEAEKDPKKIENSVKNAISIKEKAILICNANKLKIDENLFGEDLVVATVSAVRAQNSLPALENKDFAVIEAIFDVYAEGAKKKEDKISVLNRKSTENEPNISVIEQMYGDKK